MHTSRRFSLLAFLGLVILAVTPLRGAEKYLPAGQPDAVALLAPPPVAHSVEDAADLETAVRIYQAAPPADRARAADETNLTIFHFSPAIGTWFAPGKFPKTEALFNEVEAEAKAATSPAKKHWQRLRPYHVDAAHFPEAIEHADRTDYSYPSGHSTRGTVFALLLAELFPAQREALLAKGRESGWLRIEGGVHYPTDVYAGRVLGQALAREFLHSTSFQRDWAEVQAELKAAEKK